MRRFLRQLSLLGLPAEMRTAVPIHDRLHVEDVLVAGRPLDLVLAATR